MDIRRYVPLTGLADRENGVGMWSTARVKIYGPGPYILAVGPPKLHRSRGTFDRTRPAITGVKVRLTVDVNHVAKNASDHSSVVEMCADTLSCCPSGQ